MGSGALVLNVSETMSLLMRSMGYYVWRRISDEKSKEAYRLAMKESLYHVNYGWENLDIVRAKIVSIKDEAKFRYPKKLFSRRSDEIRCHNLAVDHALQIVDSLEKRFITGQCDDAPRNYKGKGTVYEDQDIFG